MPLLPGPAQGRSHAATPARSAVRPAQLLFPHPPPTAPFRPLGAVAPPIVGTGEPRATSGPPQLCSSDGSAQLRVAAGSRPHQLRGALSRAVRAALGRPRGQAMPQRACPRGRLGAAVALLPCHCHALIVSPSHMSVLCSYCVLIALLSRRGGSPVAPLSCPCHIPVAPRRKPRGRTDACWTSRANCRTWARPRGAVTPRTRAGPGGAVPELSAALP